MKIIRYTLKFLLGVLCLLVIVLVSTFTTIDDTNYKQLPYYQTTKDNIRQLNSPIPDDTASLKIGWAKVNFSPKTPTPTAGYGDRHGQAYTSVHDSVFVRAMVFEFGKTKAVMLSADLLIIPPTVIDALKPRLAALGFDFKQLFFGATHTHNSLGAWGVGYTGELFAGKYDQNTVEHIAASMAKAIALASKNTAEASLGYGQMYLADMMYNRLVGDKGTIDPFVRILKINRKDGQKALFCTYAAHSTTLDANKMVLSRDYPGVLIDSLENHDANFAMFMAGAVGSMGPLEEAKDDYEQMRNEAAGIQIELEKNLVRVPLAKPHSLGISHIALGLREPHARISESIRFRPWAFHFLFGDYPADIKAISLGNTLIVGLPCDFSGEFMAELTAFAQSKNKNLIITSFNGGYIGYITPDKYYNLDSYETRTMNWFGPQNGEYFKEIIKDLIVKL